MPPLTPPLYLVKSLLILNRSVFLALPPPAVKILHPPAPLPQVLKPMFRCDDLGGTVNIHNIRKVWNLQIINNQHLIADNIATSFNNAHHFVILLLQHLTTTGLLNYHRYMTMIFSSAIFINSVNNQQNH